MIEKILERLEADIFFFDSNIGIAPNIKIGLEIAKEIVQEVAKNGGWIPCSERLPEIDGNTSDTVLVCTIDGFQHMAFWCGDNQWRYCESGMIREPMDWVEIVAWQPLPAPYQPKGE